ncbi:bifunctional glycosyltransferase family 2/GtrA family protein [Nocardioides sp. CER19]|uniref:bifunctional glycosyltransferase family 2/GtrA family protein n=1 Tax=Nocardioides sp. CER19 TaxID=3038538 RepID=UPI002447658C|nr:bifunctional glycosyltransferase family 2/GtrA family protein [Nocardioides sp. CER19]MDH2415097.1 bifunctional glycosyltransferase family 2/GtrA family protein [Nocardioides sp. CER19]
MTALARETDAADTADTLAVATAVEFVVPVYNEEQALAESVRRLDDYLDRLPYRCGIVIADNASTDDTWPIAEELAAELPRVRALRLEEKGRGRALKAAWSSSTAAVVGYMDVDLSTDLRAVDPLVAPLLSGHSDVAIGTRLARGSRVVRGPKRELISRCYNLLLRGVLSASFSDAQCGFKAIRRDVAERLLPLVEDGGWFFDTELLVLAEEAGLRIHEVPVDWVDDPDSRVDIVATALDDLRGVRRLLGGLTAGRIAVEGIGRPRPADPALPAQVVTFGAVGIFSTLAYLVLYLGLRLPFGAQAANLVALLTTAIANTAANRRLTFGITARRGVVRHHVAGLVAFALGLGLTSGSLALLHAADPGAVRVTELTVLVLANAVTTLLRFFVLRRVMR